MLFGKKKEFLFVLVRADARLPKPQKQRPLADRNGNGHLLHQGIGCGL